MTCCIQIFTKAPVEGYCKTRLAKDIGTTQAIQFQKEMIKQVINTVLNINNTTIQLWCSPSSQHAFFNEIHKQYTVGLHNQQGDNLGEIMSNAAQSVSCTSDKIIQIGTDCPYMDEQYICNAMRELNEDINYVIGPANDGGYVLLAMNTYSKEIYMDIEWGTARVLEKLERNLALNNFAYKKLCNLEDIDTVIQYNKWKRNKFF